MSNACAGLPPSFDRFREVWHVDFEFRQDDNHCPVPVAMFAKEHRTGTEITMRRPKLLACTRAPFDTGHLDPVDEFCSWLSGRGSPTAVVNCFSICSFSFELVKKP